MKKIWEVLFKKSNSKVVENIKVILYALVIALAFRSSIAAPYRIPTGSMIPTLLVGDHLFVSKLSYALKLPIPFTNVNLLTYGFPKRGEIIVFQAPHEPDKDFVKRVLAVPGDVIEVRNKTVYLNHDPLYKYPIQPEETIDKGRYMDPDFDLYVEYVNDRDHLVQHNRFFEEQLLYRPDLRRLRDFGPFKIPEGYVFAMGDNRDNSSDSREWGLVPFRNVRGRAVITWLSWDSQHHWFRKDRFFIPIL